MDYLQSLFSTFKVEAVVFHNGLYCGNWAIDTSGSSFMAFHIVTRGECYLKYAESDSPPAKLKQGDIVIFPKDHKHCLTSDIDTDIPVNASSSVAFSETDTEQGTGLVCGYFSFQHPLMEKVIAALPDTIIVRHDDLNVSSLKRLIDILVDESRASDKGSTLVLNRLAETAFAVVLRDHVPHQQGMLAASVHPKLGPVIELLHNAPDEKWTVEKMAAEGFMSRAAFAELFKSVLGVSPMEYLTQWRIALAYRLLRDNARSTYDVALSCGYDNESSFSKAFKRVLGITPGAARAAGAT